MSKKTLLNLGLTGPISCGKGTAAEYLEKKYKFKSIKMSDFLRALARKEKVPPTRPNLENLQKKYPFGYIADRAVQKARDYNKKGFSVVVDGIRRPNQATAIKRGLKAKLILIGADQKVRFERAKRRRRKGFETTLKTFKTMEEKENKFFNMKKTFSMADYKVDNSKDKKPLQKQLDALIKKLR